MKSCCIWRFAITLPLTVASRVVRVIVCRVRKRRGSGIAALTVLVAALAGAETAELPTGSWRSNPDSDKLRGIVIEFYDDGTALVMGADKKTVQVDVKTTQKSRTFLLKLKSSQKDDEQTLFAFELKSDRVAVLTDQSSESVRMVPGGVD